MFRCALCVFIVSCLLFVKPIEDGNLLTRNPSISLITKNNMSFVCKKSNEAPFEVEMVDGDNFTMEFRHELYINEVWLIKPNGHKKQIRKKNHSPFINAHYNISLQQAGLWVFKASVTENNKFNKCRFNIKVKPIPDKMWIWILSGIGLLVLIVIIQTLIICLILKKKKARSLDQLLENNSQQKDDAVRYNALPGQKQLTDEADSDSEHLYECLDIQPSAEIAHPTPPPIETLLHKKNKVPLLPTTPGQHASSKINEIKGKSKDSNIVKPSFSSPPPISHTLVKPSPKLPRKLPNNQNPLANELNNVLLKRRQTGAGPSIPMKPERADTQKFKSPSFKPPALSKPSPRPKNLPILPNQQPTKPDVARKWPPINNQPQINHMHPKQQPMPPKLHSKPPMEQAMLSTQQPGILKMPLSTSENFEDYSEEEYQEFEDDEEEWTYETLPQYNIYSQ